MMKISIPRLTLVLLAALALLSACVSPAGPPSGAVPDLPDGWWLLESLQGQAPVAGARITLEIKPDGFGGSSGCNQYGGIFVERQAGKLKTAEIAVTAMACEGPEGVMEQEQAYLDALTRSSAYRLAGERLELLDSAGEITLVFIRQAETDREPGGLLDSAWRLVSLDGVVAASDLPFSLVFLNDHWLGGLAGCRAYVGAYTAQEGDLSLHLLAMLEADCPGGEALLAQEGQYTTKLETMARFRQEENQIEIINIRGESLIYQAYPAEASAALEVPTWSLIALLAPRQVEGIPVPLPEVSMTLSGTAIELTLDGKAAGGSAGCNRYGAEYSRQGSELALGPVGATKMACPEPEGIMEQEGRYLEALRNVTDYRIAGDLLWLLTSDGRALVYRVQAS